MVEVSLERDFHGVPEMEIVLPEPQHLKDQLLENGVEIKQVNFRTERIRAPWMGSREFIRNKQFDLETFGQKVENYARSLVEEICRKLEERLKSYNLQPTTITLLGFRRMDGLNTKEEGLKDLISYYYDVYFYGTISFDPPLTDLVTKKLIFAELERELTGRLLSEIKDFIKKLLEEIGVKWVFPYAIYSSSSKVWWDLQSGHSLFYGQPLLWKFRIRFPKSDMKQIRKLFENALKGPDVFHVLRNLIFISSVLTSEADFYVYFKGNWDPPQRTGDPRSVLIQIVDELEEISS